MDAVPASTVEVPVQPAAPPPARPAIPVPVAIGLAVVLILVLVLIRKVIGCIASVALLILGALILAAAVFGRALGLY